MDQQPKLEAAPPVDTWEEVPGRGGQVRVLAPAHGLFKGLLVVRRGIERVQLTRSMRKA